MSTEINIFRHARTVREVAAGEALFVVGEPGDLMFAVLDGAVELRLDGQVIETVRSGGIIGELVLIEPAPRSLDAVAVEPSRVAEVNEKEFVYLVQQHPTFALELMRIMAERLRRNSGTPKSN